VILFITYIFLSICLISLVTSTTANIIQQKKEIAILRAVGMTTRSLLAVLMVESLLTVLTSCLIGVLIGCFLGYVLAAQQAIFTEIFVGFHVSWETLGKILGAAVGLAVVCTAAPIYRYTRKTISETLREA
jgi:putative ABC transport system permease protein